MVMLVRDRRLEKRIIADRRARGADWFDEVWDGVYVMSPIANDEHQELSTRLAGVLDLQVGLPEGTKVRAGVNISDQPVDWRKNYRVPDVAVFLPGTKAVLKDAFWHGGPDFAIEVVSPGDRSRKKLPFYARVGTRELLLVERKPWLLELLRLVDGRMDSVGRATVEGGEALGSAVLPLTFRLTVGDVSARPAIEVRRQGGDGAWII